MPSPEPLGPPVTFVKRMTKQGKYYSIFVPQDYINSGLVHPEEFYYEITLRPVGRISQDKQENIVKK